ncbi:MAG: DUF2892 domain-containing protein [Gammaproteobacteria bacterium]|nr:DUF2892 domain-containing protein [Gammaproteobacteria bacterium]MCW8839694.1 DUF2892 domain-containing protein [Gammaproteobacteria bacterium]MCW8928168.1 DUF2892 domain-containing protein [Gammaproteobacteria bacterium]MCW8958300.1 DUF2892 domain-containing protein [Gammaproteobacteria bacterium]MCW8972450.1 DUF2892 domain-containing protein [Gammaproteobacteria bacterium]
MTVDKIVHLAAGLMILISLGLAHYHDPAWLWLTAFVGLNLAQSGITNFCPLAFMLKKSGVPEGNCC